MAKHIEYVMVVLPREKLPDDVIRARQQDILACWLSRQEASASIEYDFLIYDNIHHFNTATAELGQQIMDMANVDFIIFSSDYKTDRRCKIVHTAAHVYNTKHYHM